MKAFSSKLFAVFMLAALLIVPAISISAQDEVTLVLWHAKQDAEGDALLSIIDAFQAANPGITVEQVYNPSGTIQDSFVAAAGSGEGPDMIIWANDSVGPWATAGLIADVSGVVSDELRAQASDTAWGLFEFNGGLWGIPFSAKTLAFFYNRALVPDAPQTWAEVLEVSQELAEDGVTGLAFQNGFFHSAGFLYSLGGSLMDEDGNAAFAEGTDGAAAMDAYLQFHQDMYLLGQDASSGVVIDGSSPNPGFQQGTVAMVYDGIWNLAQYESDLGDDLGVAIMPALDNGVVPALFAQGEGFYANASILNDEAKLNAFLAWGAFITGVEGQTIAATEGGLLPVNPEIELESENLQTFAEQFALGTPFPNRQELGAFWGPMGDAITAVGQGGQTPAAARAAAYDLIQASIDEMHGM
ncbi:extracellular solute-binding protein [Anaerolineae bacterium CFX9]|jgi:maltose/maltodextrin transport system substrate-binding protein|nr:extracellular solute-binding protein [Anaerolineae bacterium CFX9]